MRLVHFALLGLLFALAGCSVLVADDLECEVDADCDTAAVCREGVCKGGSWQVGGRVKGMAGKDLQLRCGQDELELDNSGVFLFPTKYAPRTPYEVTVGRHPSNPSQTCTVAYASGTVGAEMVWSVEVTCATNTYPVRGTVSGLVPGTEVTLANNGGDPITVSADGEFTFPTPLADGSGYAVTVSAKSDILGCVVRDGTGTIAGAAVSAPRVECTARTWPLGGQVTGLAAGSEVVLKNGTSTVTVTADDPAFSFGPLIEGTSYAVTVSVQPSNPAQTCTVAQGSGTVASGLGAAVQVTCAVNTYLVGGTVTGLVPGTSVTLANNGGDEKTVDGDGSFTFETALADGSAYAVTVTGTSPANAVSCQVTDGSGTVASAEVTAPKVECTVTTWPLGGTVVGLAEGSQVVLKNGEATLPVTAEVPTFTFGELIDGASYEVTVLTQPTEPPQICTVSAGSGTITAAVDLQVNCGPAFAVNATISGLQGTGLVLALNGTGTRIDAGAGDFTFAERLGDADTYTVTVATQPTEPAQTCTVTPGTGTIDGADAAVTVDCTPLQYKIGGTIEGLSAEGLILQIDGASDLVVSAIATTFRFPEFYVDGSTHIVSVSQSPEGQTCTVDADTESVTLAGADASSVGITCTDANAPPAETGTFVAGCDHGDGLCTDLYAAQGVDTTGLAEAIASGCSGQGWTPRATECPTVERIGTCDNTTPVNGVNLQSRDRVYSTYAGTNVSSECATRGGTWVAD